MKGGRCVLLQSKTVAPRFSLDYICTEGALMKMADTLGYLIRVWLSREQAHLPEFIFFLSLHVQVSEEHGAIQSLIIVCVDLFPLFKHQVHKSIIIPVWCCKAWVAHCFIFFDLSMVRSKFAVDNFDICVCIERKNRIYDL